MPDLLDPDEAARDALRLIGADPPNWVPARAAPDGRPIDHNVSFGRPEGDVPSMRRGVDAIVARISRDLMLADLAAHEARLTATVMPDFDASLYASALVQG